MSPLLLFYGNNVQTNELRFNVCVVDSRDPEPVLCLAAFLYAGRSLQILVLFVNFKVVVMKMNKETRF